MQIDHLVSRVSSSHRMNLRNWFALVVNIAKTVHHFVTSAQWTPVEPRHFSPRYGCRSPWALNCQQGVWIKSTSFRTLQYMTSCAPPTTSFVESPLWSSINSSLFTPNLNAYVFKSLYSHRRLFIVPEYRLHDFLTVTVISEIFVGFTFITY